MVMKNRVILLLAVLAAVFAAMLFVEDKHEYKNEIELWKHDFDSIAYRPAKAEWADDFVAVPLVINRKTGFYRYPLFTLEYEENGIPVVYEGNYNIKNMFTELAVLKARGVIFEGEADPHKLGLDRESSPVLVLGAGTSAREIIIGKKTPDKQNRYFMAGGQIYITHAFIFDKLTRKISSLREKQFLFAGREYIARVVWREDGRSYEWTNRPEEKDGQRKNRWFFNGREEPALVQKESALIRLRADLYPDDARGKGHEIARLLVSFPVRAVMTVTTSDNKQTILDIYPRAEIGGEWYYPVVKKDLAALSPAYIKTGELDSITAVLARK